LVPGATYNRLYWDFPYQASSYSYVEKTLAAGRATFNLDRIGSGQSSKPLAGLITTDTEAYTVHQAIQWLRADKHYQSVTVVGHSAGSIVAAHEAGQYNDVDKLVLTGYLHTLSASVVTKLFAGGLYPAVLDSQFLGKTLDPGYLTTTTGARGRAFYSDSADPQVIAYDEAHKDVISTVDTAQLAAEIILPPDLNYSHKIKAPVLSVVGDHDVVFCGLLGVDCNSLDAVRNHENPYYANAKSFTVQVIPNTGHDLALHPSKDESFGDINQWINTH
jgi:pimeloyl-ACP methyl ester carboxylesterase